jgi:hypothetical protein
MRSKEVGLLHYSDELLLVDFAVTVSIGFIDHLLELLVGHGFAQLASNALEVSQGDLSCAIVVEESESFEDFFPGVSLGNFSSHKFHEVPELDDSLAFAIDFCDHFLDFLLLRFETEGSHGHLQLLGVDIACVKYELPTPSVSKRSKASLISCFCSSVSSFLALRVGLRGAFSFLKVDIQEFKY